MKVMFVTTERYPFSGTTVNIIKKLLYNGGLREELDEIAVVTPRYRVSDKEQETVNGIHIFRAFCIRYFDKKDALKPSSYKNFLFYVKAIFGKTIYSLQKRIDSNAFIRNDIITGLAQRIVETGHDYDIIMPFFGNYDAAFAALLAKEKLGNKVVLYQVDPASTNWVREEKEIPKIKELERKLYYKADGIITMPIIFKDIIHVCNKADLSKIRPLELPLVTDKCKPVLLDNDKKEKAICIFSGLIYLGIRDPDYTLRLFEDLLYADEIEFWMVGVSKNELPESFRDLPIRCFGLVSLEEAEQLMEQADIFVNIGNKMNNQLPSKLFDYLSFGKPIVNVCKNKDCPSLNYIAPYSLGLNLFEDEKRLEEQVNLLRMFIAENKNNRVSFDVIKEQFEDCMPEKCAKEVKNILDDVVKLK